MSPYKSGLRFRLALALTAFLLAAQGCDLLPFAGAQPPPAGPDPTAVSAIITLTAAQEAFSATLTALPGAGATQAPPIPPSETPTFTPTPTLSPTPTATSPLPAAPVQPSPIVVIVTATTGAGAPGTGGQPKIYARVDSNCRSGPGPGYTRLGYLLVGEESEIYGRNKSWTWWYIREPRRAGIMCWVWGGSTRVEGDTGSVPVIYVSASPSITKTPSKPGGGGASFSVTGVKIIKCGSVFTIIIKVKNTGDKRFESAMMKVTDLTKGKLLYGPSSSNTPFRSSDTDCTADGDQIETGQTRWIGAGLGTKSLSGHKLQIEIKLCTGEGLSGTCDSESGSYTVP